MLSQHPLTVATSPGLLMERLFKNTHKRTHKKERGTGLKARMGEMHLGKRRQF